ncbi:MAG: hypothetical protein EBR09_14670 [Proteobacteria bacterium]|nr:hypothetical protein [Pseudomonadota bacterium]
MRAGRAALDALARAKQKNINAWRADRQIARSMSAPVLDRKIAGERRVSVADGTSEQAGACAAECAPLPRIRRPQDDGRHMIARLAAAWGLDKTGTSSVRAMFSSKTSLRPARDAQFHVHHEVCFSFWGFAPSDAARWTLLEFFSWSMRPRMYMSGQTRAGSMETLVVVRADLLHVGRDELESWLESFLSTLRMSAGVHVFSGYLDEPMLACMERIRGCNKFRSNLHADWNSDLRILSEKLQRERSVRASIMAVTGVEFTSENFLRLWEHSLPRPERTARMLRRSVGLPAETTAADAGTSGSAEAAHAP